MGLNLWFYFHREVPEIRNFELINESISAYFTDSLALIGILLLLLLLFKCNKTIVMFIIIVEVTLACFDQFRWQPFVFQVILTFFIYLLSPKRFFHLLLLLLSATYFYSGIHKLNDGFIQSIWRDLILIKFLHLPTFLTSNYFVLKFGYFIGFIEFLLGILILYNRKYFIAIAFMHLFILAFIGPFGIRINAIVWGWNVLMLLYALIYYFRNDSMQLESLVKQFDCKLIAVGFLVFVLPLLNFAKLYNPYFSFELYSGKTMATYMVTKNKEFIRFKLKDPIKYHVKRAKNEFLISINDYSYFYLKVPIPPHEPIIKVLAKKMQAETSKTNRFYVSHYPYKQTKQIN